MAPLVLVVTKVFSSNYPEAAFSYETWELYIYMYILHLVLLVRSLRKEAETIKQLLL